jgi:uncharacterized lipoprotein YmbA
MLVALALSALSGCALTGKSDPLSPRYFSPELASGPAPAARRSTGAELRLGRVTSSGYLTDRIVYRTSEHELGFYEERRWTERPEAHLRRALGRSLFEQGGLVRVVSGAAPTLDIELTGFEEIRAAARQDPVARARATILVSDGRSVLREQTITVDRPIRAGVGGVVAPEAAVQSLAEAMAELVTQVTAATIAALPAKAEAPSTSERRPEAPLR